MQKINHIGFIMDGNGRWATARKLPRTSGHKAGAKKIQEVLLWCQEKQIQTVSVYAFSIENWKRPAIEVGFLMNLLLTYIGDSKTIQFFKKHQIKFIWKGTTTNLSNKILTKIKQLEAITKTHKLLNFQVLFNYGSQQNIIENLKIMIDKNLPITKETFNKINDPHNLGELDLIIRTANEHRLSNFMLFEAAYAELVFSKLNWPEYTKQEFESNLLEFHSRIRKFGEVKE